MIMTGPSPSLPHSASFHARAIWLFALDAALQYHYTSNGLRKIDMNLTTNLQQRIGWTKFPKKDKIKKTLSNVAVLL